MKNGESRVVVVDKLKLAVVVVVEGFKLIGI